MNNGHIAILQIVIETLKADIDDANFGLKDFVSHIFPH